MDKYTIKQFNRDFPNDDACLEWLFTFLYPDGVPCRKCETVTKHHRVTGRPAFVCDRCGTHVHPLADTIFEKSATPLRLWFYVIFLMASTRCGISAKQVQRETGVTYKTAWRMCHMVRQMLTDEPDPRIGSFEIDEAFIGPKSGDANKYRSKSVVLGVGDRKGKVHAYAIERPVTPQVIPVLSRHAKQLSTIYSDQAGFYKQLGREGYDHRWFNRTQHQVIKGVHVNRVEGFWSRLKRSITGVYVHVGAKHLQKYINEYEFRYNHRHDETPMFLLFLSRVASV